MIADVILGMNIETEMWISDLKEQLADNIIVIDYELSDEFFIKDGVKYMSASQGEKYLKSFDTVNFYKSLYGYPGMGGKMSSILKDIKRNN